MSVCICKCIIIGLFILLIVQWCLCVWMNEFAVNAILLTDECHYIVIYLFFTYLLYLSFYMCQSLSDFVYILFYLGL